MTKIKTLHVIQHYLPSPNFGGSPIVCDNIVKNINKNPKFSAEVLTTDLYGLKKRYEPSKKDNVFKYKIFRLKNISNSLAYKYKIANPNPFYFFDFLKIIDKYNIIHLHEYRSILNVFMCIYKKRGVKYILHPQGTFEIYGSRQIYKNIFDILFQNIILTKIDFFLALTRKEKNIIQKKGVNQEKIKVIGNGIEKLNTNKISLNNFSFKYVLYLGRINKIKGIDNLILAYYKSNLIKKNIKLIVAGNDEGFERACKKIVKNIGMEKKILFTGSVNQNEKYSLIKYANLVCYVTKNEPFGLVPLESAICGTWSVISSDAGISSFIGDFNICSFVKYGEVKQLTKFLNRLGSYKKKVSKDKIKLIYKHFSWKQITNNITEIYLQI